MTSSTVPPTSHRPLLGHQGQLRVGATVADIALPTTSSGPDHRPDLVAASVTTTAPTRGRSWMGRLGSAVAAAHHAGVPF